MTNNLFHRLRRYQGTPDREAGEDFLTEAFAWLMSKNPGLGRAFASHLIASAKWDESIPSDAEICWNTQVRTSNGVIDMVAEIRNGPVIVFEHKVWAKLQENQIEGYRKAMDQHHPGRVRTVLITAQKSQWTQNADLWLTWADVHKWLSSPDAPKVELLDELLEYLQAEGLGPPAPVSHESILSFAPGQRLLPALTTLFGRLKDEIRVSDLPAELKTILRLPDTTTRTLTFQDDWGRIGLAFPNGLDSWRPGLFAGVLYQTQDHLKRGPYEYTVPHAGPDFDLILDFNTDDGSPSWTDYVGSPEFEKLRRRVRDDPQGYEVFDILQDRQAKEQNRWHPLHLRRPLLDVLRGTASVDDQASAMTREIRTAIDVILRGGELLALTNRILAKKGAQARSIL